MTRILACLAACALMAIAMDADASMRKVPFGQVPVLGPGEGLVVIDVDGSEPISLLHIARQGSMFGGETIGDLPPGKSANLYVATAGEYRWDRIEFGVAMFRFVYNLKDDPEFRFQVRPGVINYPGDLMYRPNGSSARIHAPNRGLGSIDWLRKNHPAIYAKYHFAFTGHYADPFPDFYAAARAAQADKSDADLEKTLLPPDAGKLPIAVEDLWRDSRVQSLSLNPRGDLLAEAIYERDAWHLDLIDLKAEQQTRLLTRTTRITDLEWMSDQVLAVESSGGRDPLIERIGDAGASGRSHVEIEIPHSGYILGPVPGDPDHVLFESNVGGAMVVHKLDISGPGTFGRQQFEFSARISHGVDDAVGWITDGRGELRGAIAKQGDKLVLFHGENGKFQPVLTIDEQTGFRPLMLSADGSVFYGLSDKDRGQRELVEFDPATRTIGRTLFSKPGRDVESVKFDAHHRLTGATYYEDGKEVVDYFDQDERAIGERLAKAFPGLTTKILDRDEAGKNFIIAVQGSDRPSQIYHFALERATVALVEDSAPWLRDKHLAPAQVVHAKGSDGLPIEAYLTLPVNAHGKSPLVVYSHGGPIGVRDTLEFDPAVQLFASLGYAVLQVNFRGSEGYGRSFREAGERHFGNLIEDDIDAATRVALAQFPLDPERMCVVGASYGGYSALVSAIRWPQRFRCAVSIAGVSDQLLLFTASDASWTASGRKALEKAIGNPATDAESMRAYAPLYRYKELTLPVMLAHGTEDDRVEFEHSRRLIRMLNLAGRPPTMMAFAFEGHGGFKQKNELVLWTGIAGFLRAHLDAPPQPASTH